MYLRLGHVAILSGKNEWQWGRVAVLLVVLTASEGSGVNFYRFPEDRERRLRWIAAVGRKDWMPTKYTWLCSDQFISGSKSNDPLSPDYVPSVFAYASTPLKRKAVEDMARFKRSADVKK